MIKKEFSKQYDNHIRKSKCSPAFYLLASIIVIFAHDVKAENLSQDLDPLTLLDNPSSYQQPNIDKNAIQVARLALDKKQTPTNSNFASNLAEETVQKTTASYLLMTKGPTTYQTQQLWKARISAPDNTSSSQSKTELQTIIEQVSSVEFKPKQKTAESPIVVEPNQNPEPDKTLSDTAPPCKTVDEAELKLTNEQVTEQTLLIFKNLSQQPEKIVNPFELAEILFNANCLKEAAICYQQALKRIDTIKPEKNSDKAWILFQIGNCLRKTDMPTALKSYKQLLDEYPASQWADLAKAESNLIDWFIENDPDAIINQSKL